MQNRLKEFPLHFKIHKNSLNTVSINMHTLKLSAFPKAKELAAAAAAIFASKLFFIDSYGTFSYLPLAYWRLALT